MKENKSLERRIREAAQWLERNWKLLLSVAIVAFIFWLPASEYPILASLVVALAAVWFLPRLLVANRENRLLSESFRCIEVALLASIVTLALSSLVGLMLSFEDTPRVGDLGDRRKVGLVGCGFAFVFWAFLSAVAFILSKMAGVLKDAAIRGEKKRSVGHE